jgi:hypothetical protein
LGAVRTPLCTASKAMPKGQTHVQAIARSQPGWSPTNINMALVFLCRMLSLSAPLEFSLTRCHDRLTCPPPWRLQRRSASSRLQSTMAWATTSCSLTAWLPASQRSRLRRLCACAIAGAASVATVSYSSSHHPNRLPSRRACAFTTRTVPSPKCAATGFAVWRALCWTRACFRS